MGLDQETARELVKARLERGQAYEIMDRFKCFGRVVRFMRMHWVPWLAR